MVCVSVSILSRTRVNVLSAAWVEVAAAVEERDEAVGDSGSESVEASVEAEEAGDATREESDAVECGDAGIVSDSAASERSVSGGTDEAGSLRVTFDAFECG